MKTLALYVAPLVLAVAPHLVTWGSTQTRLDAVEKRAAAVDQVNKELSDRLGRIERDLAVVQTDARYIREAVDELKRARR